MSEWIRIRVKDFYKDAVGELEYTYVTREVYEALVDTFRKEAHAQEMRLWMTFGQHPDSSQKAAMVFHRLPTRHQANQRRIRRQAQFCAHSVANLRHRLKGVAVKAVGDDHGAMFGVAKRAVLTLP